MRIIENFAEEDFYEKKDNVRDLMFGLSGIFCLTMTNQLIGFP
jgi:hypothetical protein